MLFSRLLLLWFFLQGFCNSLVYGWNVRVRQRYLRCLCCKGWRSLEDNPDPSEPLQQSHASTASASQSRKQSIAPNSPLATNSMKAPMLLPSPTLSSPSSGNFIRNDYQSLRWPCSTLLPFLFFSLSLYYCLYAFHQHGILLALHFDLSTVIWMICRLPHFFDKCTHFRFVVSLCRSIQPWTYWCWKQKIIFLLLVSNLLIQTFVHRMWSSDFHGLIAWNSRSNFCAVSSLNMSFSQLCMSVACSYFSNLCSYTTSVYSLTPSIFSIFDISVYISTKLSIPARFWETIKRKTYTISLCFVSINVNRTLDRFPFDSC